MHLPELLQTVTKAVTASCDRLTDSELCLCLKLCSQILSHVLPSVNSSTLGGNASSGQSYTAKALIDVRIEAENDTVTTDGLLSESDVFVSADSDTADLPASSSCFSSPAKSLPDDGVECIRSVPDVERELSNDPAETADIPSTGEPNRHTLTNGPSLCDKDRLDVKRSPKDITATESDDSESFNDFVQYGDTVLEEIPSTRMLSPRKQDKSNQTPKGASQTLIETCIQSFHKLFSVIVSSRIMQDKEISSLLLGQLMSTVPSDRSGTSDTISLLEDDTLVSGLVPSQASSGRLYKLKVEKTSTDLISAFECGCQLLVDFASFPMYCTDHHQVLPMPAKTSKSNAEMGLT